MERVSDLHWIRFSIFLDPINPYSHCISLHIDADQGLLLQWVKYEKSEVTIIEGNTLERWSEINPSDHSLIGPIEVTEVSGRSKTIGLIDKKTDIIKSCGGINNDLRRDYHVMIGEYLIDG